MDERRVVRSYQRVFVPDRRIYAIDGRTIPIPGGVPLRWLGAATAVLVAVLVLASLTPVVIAGVSIGAAVVAGRLRGWRVALGALIVSAAVCFGVGVVLRVFDWPLRLVVLPAAVATVAIRTAPDGRSAAAYARGWVRAQLAGPRRLGAPVPSPRRVVAGRVRVAGDHYVTGLPTGRVTGPVVVRFREPVVVRRWRRDRIRARPLGDARCRGVVLDRVELGDGERLELRA